MCLYGFHPAFSTLDLPESISQDPSFALQEHFHIVNMSLGSSSQVQLKNNTELFLLTHFRITTRCATESSKSERQSRITVYTMSSDSSSLVFSLQRGTASVKHNSPGFSYALFLTFLFPSVRWFSDDWDSSHVVGRTRILVKVNLWLLSLQCLCSHICTSIGHSEEQRLGSRPWSCLELTRFTSPTYRSTQKICF